MHELLRDAQFRHLDIALAILAGLLVLLYAWKRQQVNQWVTWAVIKIRDDLNDRR
jgi:hypothetical protein